MQNIFEFHGGKTLPPYFPQKKTETKNKLYIVVDISGGSVGIPVNILYSTDYTFVKEFIFKVPDTEISKVGSDNPLFHFEAQSTQLDISNTYFLTLSEDVSIAPDFWTLVAEASPGTSYRFKDNFGNDNYELSWRGAEKTIETNTVGIHKHPEEDLRTSRDFLIQKFQRYLNTTLQHMIVNVGDTMTPLCHLGLIYNTDKCPYSLHGHRHPYTPIYDMFFAPLRSKSIKLGEIGVLNGASTAMWNHYFPKVNLYGFDIDEKALSLMKELVPLAIAERMDVSSLFDMREKLKEVTEDGLFDILIDDSSHNTIHQALFLQEAIHFVKPGGILVIEDIFREFPISRFEEILQGMPEKVERAIIINPEHPLRLSKGWENDRMLFVWVR